MAYCSINFMQTLLPKLITIGDTNITTPTLSQPATAHTISTRTAQLFINFASQEIDSRLSTVYLIPLKRIKIHEAPLTVSCQKGSKTVTVGDNGPFRAGYLVRLSDKNHTEINEVDLLPIDPFSVTTVTLVNPTTRNYTTDNKSILSLISYPEPIPLLCARIAVAAVIDKQFVAEQNPDISNYGKSQRTLATNVLDEIMAGTIRLNGQEFVGRRFIRTQLRDTMNTSGEIQRGSGKEV